MTAARPGGRAVVLGVLILALSVSFAVSPVDRAHMVYDWDPERDGDRVALLLVERVPDRMELDVACVSSSDEAVTFASSRRLEHGQTLLVRSEPGRISVEGRDPDSRDRVLVAIPTPAASDCIASVQFDRRSQQLLLTVDGDQAKARMTFEMTGLHAVPDRTSFAGLKVSVETSPSSAVRNSGIQRTLLLALILLLVALLVDEWHARGAPSTSTRPPRRRWEPVDTVVLALSTIILAVDLPRTDDGRILGRLRQPGQGVLTSSVSTMYENVSLPQRGLYENLLAVVAQRTDTVLGLRSVALLVTVAAWLILRRVVLAALIGHPARPVAMWSAAALHVAFVAAWAATLRPEPFLALLLIINLALVSRWRTIPVLTRTLAVATVASLALATHVVGLTVGLAALPRFIASLKDDWHEQRSRLMAGITSGTGVALTLPLLGQNLGHALASADGYRETGEQSEGVLDVHLYVAQALSGTSAMRLTVILGVVGWIALLAAAARSSVDAQRQDRTLLLLGLLLTPAAFLLTTSKWLWHLALLAPLAVVGGAVLIEHLRGSRHARLHLMALSTVLATGIAWSLVPAWRTPLTSGWEATLTRQVSPEVWSSRFPDLAGPGTRLSSWLALLLVVVAVHLVGSRSIPQRWPGTDRVTAALLAGTVILVTTIQLLPAAVDARATAPEWTFVRQSVVGLWDEEARCGVAAATPAVRAHLETIPGVPEGATRPIIASNSRGGLLNPCARTVFQHHGVWTIPDLVMGSLQADQRRIGAEFDLVGIACHDFPGEAIEDRLCFSRLGGETSTVRLEPVSVQWRRSD